MIETSGVFIKEYSNALSYDPSYISKWMHDVNLPVRKNADKINSVSAEFFANVLWENGSLEKLKSAFSKTEINFPESINSKNDLQEFLVRLFSSSYIESAHPINREYMKSVPNLPHLNAYVSDSLDEILGLLHSHCKYMVHTKKVLQIFSTMPTSLLTEVIASHNDSYCMLFRAKQVELNYFIPYDASTLESLVQMTVIAHVLKTLNPESNIKLRYSDIQYTTQFVYTQGCYFLFRMTFGNKDLYYLIDNPHLIQKYEIYLESLIESSENAGNINSKKLTETKDFVKVLTESDNYVFSGDDFLLLLTLMSKDGTYGFKCKLEDELVFALRSTFRTLLREKRIDFYISEDALTNFEILENSCIYEKEYDVLPEDVIKLASDLFFTIEGNDDVKFHIYSGSNILSTFNMNSLICDRFVRLAYFGSKSRSSYGDIMYSENSVLIDKARDDFVNSVSGCINKTLTPKEMYEFMNFKLLQKDAD
ncbi:hypothetical protein [Microaceticoccus formicicus]|uniref:hypothetical protein n=1 Tax=Microaceticoccus formicicus TaxID=3118105 RepID=UPI003CCFF8B0|nr:hypothetical protein VZL98_02675 [Peptoniphilaceae bacterium AMB_02]